MSATRRSRTPGPAARLRATFCSSSRSGSASSPRTRSRAASPTATRPQAFDNGLQVIDFERRMHGLFELDLQGCGDCSATLLMTLASWTYWNSAVHRRRARAALGLPAAQRGVHRASATAILLANADRARRLRAPADGAAADVPGLRLRSTRSPTSAALNHGSGLVQLAANPYAAMPSLHARRRADRRARAASARAEPARQGALARSGRPGSGSRSWRPATTSGSTSSPASSSPASRA